MSTKAHEITVSPDHVGDVSNLLLQILQQVFIPESTSTLEEAYALLALRHVLFVGVDYRLTYPIAQLLSTQGFQPIITENASKAFSLFLQGTIIPFVILLGQENPNDQPFLQRLVQQIELRYKRSIILVRLHSLPSPTRGYSAPPPPSHRVMPRSDQVHTTGTLPSPLPQPRSSLSPSIPIPLPPSTPKVPEIHPAASSIQFKAKQPSNAYPVPHKDKGSDKQKPYKQEQQKILLSGQDLGRFHVEVLINDGTYARVYRAYDRLREKSVAFKAMSMDTVPYAQSANTPQVINPLQIEYNLLKPLHHPHLLKPFNSGQSYISGSPFIYKTMPYYKEGSLAQWLRRNARARCFSPQDVLPIFSQVAEAIQCLHDHNIVYSNFKPSNLLVSNTVRQLKDLQVVLTDLIFMHENMWMPHAPDAYPYLAPECWQGTVSPASDQYALAAFIYELLTGRPPFQGSSEHAMRHLHMSMQPQLPSTFNPELPAFVNATLLRALSKEPDERFSSVSDFIRVFKRYCGILL